jgi:hypothetical protein
VQEDREELEDDEKPGIDLSKSVGEAGHEVEELGYSDVPDTGPLVGSDGESDEDVELEIARDRATEFPSD